MGFRRPFGFIPTTCPHTIKQKQNVGQQPHSEGNFEGPGMNFNFGNLLACMGLDVHQPTFPIVFEPKKHNHVCGSLQVWTLLIHLSMGYCNPKLWLVNSCCISSSSSFPNPCSSLCNPFQPTQNHPESAQFGWSSRGQT